MYYTIATFGCPTFGRIRNFYRSREAAVKDAIEVGGGSCTNIRVLECPTAAEAKSADISDSRYNVVWMS